MSTLLEQLNEKLRDRPDEELRKVLAFVESLAGSHPPDAPQGSAERILPLVGSLSFDEGELDELLSDIQHSRELDLDR